MRCKNCGQKLADNMMFCPNCGTDLQNFQATLNQPGAPTQNTSTNQNTGYTNDAGNVPPSQPYVYRANAPYGGKKKNSGLSIAAFVLSF